MSTLQKIVINNDVADNKQTRQLISLNNKKNYIKARNRQWLVNKNIPSWVNIENVDLDQFFTKPVISQKLYNSFVEYLQKENVNADDYVFVEPSAGNGSFYNILPKERRLGLDIMPLCEGVYRQDFLSWYPEDKNKKYIFIGNPPFGYRAWLALTFINHAAQFADYVGFILPMAFQSDGKGSPKYRVKGLKLIHSEVISPNSFYNPDGKPFKVNALWQIWKKGVNIRPKRKTCSQWVELFTVDMRKERLCGQEKLHQADFFLQRTYYNTPPSLVKNFSQVKYVCGYGLIIKKDKEKVLNALEQTNWNNYSNLAAHNCHHISMYHIEKALTDKGFVDV